MKKQIELCDWCQKDEAVVIIIKGEYQNDCLCKSCQDDFLLTLSDEYLNDLDGTGEWRTAKKEEEEK